MLPITRRKEQWLDPFRDLEKIQNQMNRLFDFSLSKGGDGGTFLEGVWSPEVDIFETDQNFTVKADLPGLNKEDIDIQVQNDTLVIRGEKKQESEHKDKGVIRTERVYGSFSRAILLPGGVDANNIKASYKNGVLELSIPKKEEAKPKQIKVDIEK